MVTGHNQDTGRSYHSVVVSRKANSELVREYYSTLGWHGDLSRWEDFISDDYIDHNADDDTLRGPECVRAHIFAVLTTFPDLELKVEHIMAEDFFVVTRVSETGLSTCRIHS